MLEPMNLFFLNFLSLYVKIYICKFSFLRGIEGGFTFQSFVVFSFLF